jgi:dihydrofolate reductase
MTKLTCDITMSLDGFVAGPNPRTEQPLGDGGDRLHQWAYGLESFRERHGLEGGTTNRDAEILEESLADHGAAIMGRRMFGGGDGPWDESWKGWWGDEPPFRMPVFVLTHHPRAPLVMQGGTSFTFVTDGIESALEQARVAAGGRASRSAEGPTSSSSTCGPGCSRSSRSTWPRCCWAGGTRLFDHLDPDPIQLEVVRVVESPAVTHLRYRVVR